MFEKGDYISFANCGLPYYIGDVIRIRRNSLSRLLNHFHSVTMWM